MKRRQPRSTSTYTLLPYTTLFRSPVVNLTKLSERREAAPEIKHRMDYDPIEQKMVSNPRGRLLLYREIDPTMEYTIGADVAKGTGGEQEGAEGDWSVAQVLDRHKRDRQSVV